MGVLPACFLRVIHMSGDWVKRRRRFGKHRRGVPHDPGPVQGRARNALHGYAAGSGGVGLRARFAGGHVETGTGIPLTSPGVIPR